MKNLFINLASPLLMFIGFSLNEVNVTLQNAAYLASAISGLYALYVNANKKRKNNAGK